MNVHLDQIFRSLSDSTRRDIVRRLVRNELSVSEIAQPYEMSIAAISKHLKVLEKAGLIKRRREGKKYIIQTDVEPLKEIDDWIDFYRAFWEEAFDKLDDYLTELQKGEDINDE